METFARVILGLIVVAVLVNYKRGGGDRVKSWAVAFFTGTDTRTGQARGFSPDFGKGSAGGGGGAW